jgi:hypothetical protein
MANFLDLTTGLPALWAKIKSKFYTKAEVDAAIPSASSTSPYMDGDATVGVSTAYARADHRHPTDTSRAAVTDVLTKTNTTSYTPTADYNPATKKYVDDTVAAAAPSCATTAEIEEMCDALGFRSVIIDTSDYEVVLGR